MKSGSAPIRPIHPVILSGGSGTRLWPMSRARHPKQFLPLVSGRSLLQDTARRVADGTRFAPPTVVCNEEHRFVIAEQLRECGAAARRIVLEPEARNTAPAAAVAALCLPDSEALMLVMPSDHAIGDERAFLAAIEIGAAAAEGGALVTFGVTPDRPETGYGYIRRGRRLGADAGAYRVRAFVEKPALRRAKRFLVTGEYLWNAGLFLFQAKTFLAELDRLQPAIGAAARKAVADGREDLDFFRLDGEGFSASPAISIDYAVMEHTSLAAVVPLDAGWSDVGAWSGLWDLAAKDEDANALLGPVAARDVRGSYVRSEGPVVAALGVENLVIVATEDAVLVAPRARAQDIRALVEDLRAHGHAEVDAASTVYRPWGTYKTIDAGDGFLVKRITVKAHASLSLQRHRHRAEHWVVVSGTAEVTRGQEVFRLQANESTYIPLGTVHRLANPGDEPLHLVEVQSGGLLSEDDIERLDDRYGRR